MRSRRPSSPSGRGGEPTAARVACRDASGTTLQPPFWDVSMCELAVVVTRAGSVLVDNRLAPAREPVSVRTAAAVVAHRPVEALYRLSYRSTSSSGRDSNPRPLAYRR